jgi:hypothetical protein
MKPRAPRCAHHPTSWLLRRNTRPQRAHAVTRRRQNEIINKKEGDERRT